MVNSCCFSLGGNLDFRDFLQKKFFNINYSTTTTWKVLLTVGAKWNQNSTHQWQEKNPSTSKNWERKTMYFFMSIFWSLKSTRTTTTAATTRRRWWSKMLGKRRQKTATATLQLTLIGHGREPWSSGYERRLTFQRLRVLIAAPYTGWTFFTLICCKNCIVCLRKLKLNEKEAGVGLFFWKKKPLIGHQLK